MRLPITCLLLLFFFGISCSRDAEEEVCHDCAIERAQTACATAEDGQYVDSENSEYAFNCEDSAVKGIVWCGHDRNAIIPGFAVGCLEKDGGDETEPPQFFHWSWRPEGCSVHCANNGARQYAPCEGGCTPYSTTESCVRGDACY